MKTMAYKVIDRLFVVVYGTAQPTAHEWVRYLDVLDRHGIARSVQLIVTEGGNPTSQQRKDLHERLRGYAPPVAVLTACVSTRGVVTALSWFNRNIRVFPRKGMLDALAYLHVPASRSELIEREVVKLHSELDDRTTVQASLSWASRYTSRSPPRAR